MTAEAVIEGRVQRAAVAPFAGFLRQAIVRPGDTVVGGETVAELDQRDQSWEPAVHASTHPCSAAAYAVKGYRAEILDCRDELLRRLKEVSVAAEQPEVQIRGDGGAPYEFVGRVVLACQRAGIVKLGFITEPPPRG